MEYIHLGRSGLSVSRICLGTMNFGPLTTATEAEAIMDQPLGGEPVAGVGPGA
jgi:NDP-hexose C3-ketoreductase / dTDP-4-oxo-2-deoxy-alpha-D-pentos-2-ene 2,3-reductase